MKIVYQDTDITNMVQVKECIVSDTCGCRCDSLEIVFENAAGWFRWGPKEDDRIVVSQDLYDSGTMYVNTIMPEDGKFKIYATSLPCKSRTPGYRTFVNNTIAQIMEICAAESGMNHLIYGIDGDYIIPYIQRNDESCAAFLSKLLIFEGAALKCVNGRYAAIGIEYAQNRESYRGFTIRHDQQNAYYSRMGTSFKTLTIKNPFVSVTVEDTAVDASHMNKTVNVPANDNTQAGRWARNMLLDLNRKCESIILQAEFEPLIAALTRIDITGDTDATGEWLVEKAEHDLINLKTSVKAHRCLRTIQ